jgi:hypothetical protein
MPFIDYELVDEYTHYEFDIQSGDWTRTYPGSGLVRRPATPAEALKAIKTSVNHLNGRKEVTIVRYDADGIPL